VRWAGTNANVTANIIGAKAVSGPTPGLALPQLKKTTKKQLSPGYFTGDSSITAESPVATRPSAVLAVSMHWKELH
jgi:hypothetical protein